MPNRPIPADPSVTSEPRRRAAAQQNASAEQPTGRPADISVPTAPGVPASRPARDQPQPASPGVPEIPPLEPGQPPLALLVDYDGTIALTDVSDTIIADHVPGEWAEIDRLYTLGRVGSRSVMEHQIALLTADPAAVIATAAAQPHDPAFVPFVQRAREAGIPVEIVSDGFGFFIGPAMAALGLPDVPIATALTSFEGGPRILFPNGHPACFVCGTCKRQRVLAHQAAGRAVAFIGDGASDRYAAGYSDLVFAKRNLLPICEANSWPYKAWSTFEEISAWLEETITAWRADPSSLPRTRQRPYFCGPEIWGEGRTDPPEPEDERANEASYQPREPSKQEISRP